MNPPQTLSFVVPAHNEEALLAQTLSAINRAAGVAGRPCEIIVVDDASTDQTASIARRCGARVEHVHLRHIGAVRNAGARVASGDSIFFVDADTILPVATFRAAVRALDEGASGGGSRVTFEGRIPLLTRAYLGGFFVMMRVMRWAAGCFLFADRRAFESVGGFDERYLVSEEIHLSAALKRCGRFVLLREAVMTSGRRARLYSPWQIYRMALRMSVSGPKSWRRRAGLELWYDGRREDAAPADVVESRAQEKPTPGGVG